MTDLFIDLPKTRKEAIAIGTKYFFTNKPCKQGHIDKRFARTNRCVECKLTKSRAYYEATKEARKEQDREYRAANREVINERKRGYYEANRETIKEQDRARYAANRETISERKRLHRAANREALREQERKEYASRAGKEKKRAYRARKAGKSPTELNTRRTPEPSRFVYYLVIKDAVTNEKLFLKVGITNNPTARLKTHARHLARQDLMFDTILIKDFETEEAARAIEYKIKNSFIVYNSGIIGFTDECFLYLPQFEFAMLSILSG